MVLAVVLVALAAVLIALIVLIVSAALTVLIAAVGIDVAVIIAAADIVAVVIIAEAETVVVEEIAAEEDSFRFINGNPVAYREEPLHVAGALLYKYKHKGQIAVHRIIVMIINDEDLRRNESDKFNPFCASESKKGHVFSPIPQQRCVFSE